MEKIEQAKVIDHAIREVETSLQALAAAGKGVPAVERNVVRLLGSLRALDIQFSHAREPEAD